MVIIFVYVEQFAIISYIPSIQKYGYSHPMCAAINDIRYSKLSVRLVRVGMVFVRILIEP